MTNELLPSTSQVLPEEQRGLTPARRTAAILGGLAVAVIAVASIVTWMAARDDSATGEALFMLPVDDWPLSSATVAEPNSEPPATDERFIEDGRLFGMADRDGFDGLRAVVEYPESPLPGARWEPTETPQGDSYRRLDDSFTFAHRLYTPSDDALGLGGGWQVASSPSDLVHAYAMLSNDIDDDVVLLAVFAPPKAPETPTASFVMTSPAGSTFTVETAAGSPLFDAATFAERIEPADIDGTAGWILTIDDAETIVTWSPESGRTVSVRSSAPRDAIVDAARRLETVSADEWTAAFPGLGAD